MGKRVIVALLGVVVGIFCAILFTVIVMWLYPIMKGAGGDEMTRGILGWMLLVFSTPIFAVIGGIIGYRKYS